MLATMKINVSLSTELDPTKDGIMLLGDMIEEPTLI
jgi:hypothetical protein